jgi:hypothetical protein
MLPGALSSKERLPSPDAGWSARPWRVASAADLSGTFESVEIRGMAAAVVVRVTYCFHADGRYTGEAVLVFADGPAARQISGTWQLVAGRLHLGRDSEPADIRVDGRRLKLATSLGTVILERTG